MWGDQQAALFQALEDDTEPLTPSQMTFLKIIDSIELNRTPLDPDEEHPSPDPNYFLIPTFHKLAKYTLASLKSGNDDPRLPKIMAGLVLVVQILTTIGLAVQARLDEGHRKNKIGGALKTVKTMKSKSKGVGLIKPLIGESSQAPALTGGRTATTTRNQLPAAKTFHNGGKQCSGTLLLSARRHDGHKFGHYQPSRCTNL
jgi:hypothetical protein